MPISSSARIHQQHRQVVPTVTYIAYHQRATAAAAQPQHIDDAREESDHVDQWKPTGAATWQQQQHQYQHAPSPPRHSMPAASPPPVLSYFSSTHETTHSFHVNSSGVDTFSTPVATTVVPSSHRPSSRYGGTRNHDHTSAKKHNQQEQQFTNFSATAAIRAMYGEDFDGGSREQEKQDVDLFPHAPPSMQPDSDGDESDEEESRYALPTAVSIPPLAFPNSSLHVAEEKEEEEDMASPRQHHPVNTTNMSRTHRMILEKMYNIPCEGSDDGETTMRTNRTSQSSRREKQKHRSKSIVGISDGLHRGMFASANSEALSHQRPSTVDPAVINRASANMRMLTTARSQTPRITQLTNTNRLASGQSVMKTQRKSASPPPTTTTSGQPLSPTATPATTSAEASNINWSYLTSQRKTREHHTTQRNARIASARTSRFHAMQSGARGRMPEEMSLVQMEEQERKDRESRTRPKTADATSSSSTSKSDSDSTTKVRRPPAQTSFHDAALTSGVLSRVNHTSPLHYRLSAAIPGALTLAHDPHLVAWRLDANAWLESRAKYVSKQVSTTQMSELRILYDSLDEDASDSLDAREIALAMRVCGMREEHCQQLAVALLEWMGKSRYEGLTFAEFAYAVLHYEIPVSTRDNLIRARFGMQQKMQPLFTYVMQNSNGGATSFSQNVMEFKRHRLYQLMKKSTGIEVE